MESNAESFFYSYDFSHIFMIFFWLDKSKYASALVCVCVYAMRLYTSLYIIIRLLLCRCEGGRVSGVTLAAQLSITLQHSMYFVAGWRTSSKMQMIMTKTAVALSKYSICLSPIGWTGNSGAHTRTYLGTHSQEIRFNCFPYRFPRLFDSLANFHSQQSKNIAEYFGRDFSHSQKIEQFLCINLLHTWNYCVMLLIRKQLH